MSGIMSGFFTGGWPPITLTVGTLYSPRTDTTEYGYAQGQYGSCVPSVNNFPPDTTNTISYLEYSELTNKYYLTLANVTSNSGWTSININGLILLRASGVFTSNGWYWAASDSGAALTGSVGSNVQVTFS